MVKEVIGAFVLQAEIEKLRTCTKQDSCGCQAILHLDELPWSNKFSCTIKQITIARSPKVCIDPLP